MASLICFIKGDRRAVNQFLDELQSKYLSFKYEKADVYGNFIKGTEEKYYIPISIRYLPLGMWEIVFPEEHKDIVLTTILNKNYIENKILWLDKYLFFLRRGLKIEKIPDFNKSKFMPIFKNGVDVIPIGYKKDIINEDGHENL